MNEIFKIHLAEIEKNIEHFLPKTPDSKWQDRTFGKEFEGVNTGHAIPLYEPASSLVRLGGKRWRPLFLVLCAKASGCTDTSLPYSLAPLVEFVHTASLIHDDIEDSSESRRGQPAAYITYGTDIAINSGSWLYFHAACAIEEANCPAELKLRLYSMYAQELRRLHLGQAMDIAWHKDPEKIPTAEEYIAMVKNKTGTLASLSAKTGVLCSGASDSTVASAGEIAAEIGAGFQIIDDVINLTKGNPGKKRGDDIVEGKKSLPVIDFFTTCPDSNKKEQLSNCFRRASAEGIDSPAVEEAIALLSENGSIERAKIEGTKCIKNSCRRFTELFGESEETSLVTQLFVSMAEKYI